MFQKMSKIILNFATKRKEKKICFECIKNILKFALKYKFYIYRYISFKLLLYLLLYYYYYLLNYYYVKTYIRYISFKVILAKL